MADKRITELNLHTSPQLSDVIPIVNSGETKKTTYGTLYNTIRGGLFSGSSQVIFNDISSNPFTQTSNSVILKTPFDYFVPLDSDNVYLGYVGDGSDFIWKELFLGARGIDIDSTRISINELTNNVKFLDRDGNVLSAEVDYDTVFNKPTLVSGSSQIDITQTQNYGDVMITGSLSDTTLTFTKGDSSTFNIDLSESFITPSQTGSFVESSYISLYSTASQQLVASGSAQPVTFTSLWAQNGISLVDGTKLTMEKQGVYQFNFVAQLANPDNAVHEAYFWIKYNGSNFPNSTTKMTLPTRKDSGDASSQLMTMNIVGQNIVDNGYIELWWTGDSTLLSLQETPAFGPVPETPSIIADIIRVG